MHRGKRRLPTGAQDTILSRWACGPRSVMKTLRGKSLVSPHIRLLGLHLFSIVCGTFSMVPPTAPRYETRSIARHENVLPEPPAPGIYGRGIWPAHFLFQQPANLIPRSLLRYRFG